MWNITVHSDNTVTTMGVLIMLKIDCTSTNTLAAFEQWANNNLACIGLLLPSLKIMEEIED